LVEVISIGSSLKDASPAVDSISTSQMVEGMPEGMAEGMAEGPAEGPAEGLAEGATPDPVGTIGDAVAAASDPLPVTTKVGDPVGDTDVGLAVLLVLPSLGGLRLESSC
jgi:hypothetical protein